MILCFANTLLPNTTCQFAKYICNRYHNPVSASILRLSYSGFGTMQLSWRLGGHLPWVWASPPPSFPLASSVWSLIFWLLSSLDDCPSAKKALRWSCSCRNCVMAYDSWGDAASLVFVVECSVLRDSGVLWCWLRQRKLSTSEQQKPTASCSAVVSPEEALTGMRFSTCDSLLH